MRFLSLASVVGADQTVRRSPASAAMSFPTTGDGFGVAASWAAILLSMSTTCARARFHRNLQFRRNQPVFGIGGIILPESSVGGVAGSFPIAAEGVPDLVAVTGCLRLGLGGGSNRAGLVDAQECFLNRIVDAQPTEGDAARLAIVEHRQQE